MKEMVLHAKTDTIGSECTIELGHTEEEWLKLTEVEQQQIVDEFMGNVVETWVVAERTNNEQ